MEKVAAVILNYNTPQDTVNCVRLLMQEKGVDLKIIIVDNASNNNSVEIIKKELDQGIILIENKINKGYSAGNNLGLKRAIEEDCKYALVINPDVEIADEHALEKAVQIFKNDKSIAMLGPDVVDMSGVHCNPQREFYFLEDVFWPISLLLSKLNKGDRYVTDYKTSDYCVKVTGCCFVADLEKMKEIDFFDENVFLYSEESIISARIYDAGYKVYYCKDIQAKHNHIASEKGDAKARLAQFLKSRSYYFENYKYKNKKIKKWMALKAIHLEQKYYSRSKEK